MEQVERVRRNLKLKKSFLFGALITSPILAFENVMPGLTENLQTISPNQNIEQNLPEKGSLNTEDAEKLINDFSVKKNIDSNLKLINESNKTNLKKNKKVELNFFESDSLVKFDLLNINEIIQSKIIEINSGWQILLQFSEDKEIDISKFKQKRNNFLDLEIIKFNDKIYLINIINTEKFISKKPIITNKNSISINIEILPNKLSWRKNYLFPFLNKFRKKNPVYNNKNKAVAPPLGDIASGSLVLANRGFIKLDGPRQSLSLNNDSAKYALMKMAQQGGYGFVLANNSTNNSSESSIESEGINDGPYVTLSFVDEDYSVAFNSILLASGLQAKKNNNLIIVGQNVLGKSFGPKLSKVFRLNQSSASSAADYLATLGASMSKVDTITGESTGGNGDTTNSASYKYIDSYSALTGPLVGLKGTTDSRLQTITLVGSSELISIAEKYLKQLDLRQRQVALSVKILDVEIINSDSFSNDMAFRSGSSFIVNENGKLFGAFGSFIPPALSTSRNAEEREYSQNSTIEEGVESNNDSVTKTLTTSLIPNPGWQYPANQLYDFLVAQIRSSSTKVLANPTLILSENAEKIEGGAEIVGDMSNAQATIGRPFANESFVTLGTNVITDYKTSTSEEGGTTTCEAEFSTAGLTFGARVNKIDDNGFVTFSLSPKLTSVSEIIDIPNCGPINILSVRRLDTGTLRVKDSHTLILTGVISDLDSEVITKTPILGDIPILGRLFRSTAGNKRKSELVILVTPKIIDDSYPQDSKYIGIGVNTILEKSKQIIEDKL